MNKGFIISLLVCSFAARPVLAQFNDPKFVVVAAKPMSYSDSNMVKQLFFSALREKTIESYTLAAELFNRILQIDPANDASMFELAKIKKIQNNEAGARELLKGPLPLTATINIIGLASPRVTRKQTIWLSWKMFLTSLRALTPIILSICLTKPMPILSKKGTMKH